MLHFTLFPVLNVLHFNISTSRSLCSMSNMAVCWYFLDVLLSQYVARFIYLSIYLFEMNCLASLSLGAGVTTNEDISRKLLQNSCSVRYGSVYTARAGLSYRASARVRRVDYFIRGRHQNSVGRRKTFPPLLSSC